MADKVNVITIVGSLPQGLLQCGARARELPKFAPARHEYFGRGRLGEHFPIYNADVSRPRSGFSGPM